AAACDAGQAVLRRELDAFLPDALDIGETDDMRHDFALRIVALGFLAGMDAVDVQLCDLVGDFRLDLALEINEAAVRIEPAVQIALAQTKQASQFAQLVRRRIDDILGDSPDRLD